MTKSALRLEAEEIVERLGLLRLLEPFGDARIVGSVALDLIVRRDIDMHVLTETEDLMAAAQAIAQRIPDAPDVSVTDYRERGGVKVGAVCAGLSGDWKIDIWLTNQIGSTGFALVDHLTSVLMQEHRDAILRIKRHYHGNGLLCNGMSSRIYDAVTERGVRNVAEFERTE